MTNIEISKYTFSGHDSFQCRQFWLKKGYVFVKDGQTFNSEDAVVKLGVGKNMVSAIRYWMKAFNIIDSKDNLTDFGTTLIDEETGYDPYLEDGASLCLFHYQLVKTKLASIYSIIFNGYRKEKLFFTKETFLNYLKRIQEANPELSFNNNTIAKDFSVFANMYKEDNNSNDIGDSFSANLSELGNGKNIFCF